MTFNFTKINKSIELDDELVKEYSKYKELNENLFLTAFYLFYNEIPEDMSVEEMSLFCNKAMVDDLEILHDNAVVINYIKVLALC